MREWIRGNEERNYSLTEYRDLSWAERERENYEKERREKNTDSIQLNDVSLLLRDGCMRV